MRKLYTYFIRLYEKIIRRAARKGNKKAELWINGRVNIWERLKSPNPDDQWIWIHVASLGEFEQIVPVLEALKRNYPQYKLLLTFFSPSGYEVKKDYPLADMVDYMPLDTVENAERLVQNFNFKAVIFVKYEFWYNHIKVLKDKNIPLYYICMVLRKRQYILQPWGWWFRNHFYKVKYFFAQNNMTANLLCKMGLENVTVVGDTRFDRVYQIAQQGERFPEIEQFIDNRKCIIAGSSWPSDEKIMYHFINNLQDDYCFILVPHDISDTHIRQIELYLDDYQLYTNFNPNRRTSTLVINKIGILSKIYRYARFAYIGAGFYDGIHNIQEAIVYDIPVVFGPKYKNFEEAVDLVELKGAFTIRNKRELENMFYRLINDEEFYAKSSKICHEYVLDKIGATEKTMRVLEAFMLEENTSYKNDNDKQDNEDDDSEV